MPYRQIKASMNQLKVNVPGLRLDPKGIENDFHDPKLHC